MAEADPQKTFNVEDANTDLSALAARAHAGEEIVLAKAGKPYAKLVPYSEDSMPSDEDLPPRKPGRFKHLLGQVSAEAVLAPCYTEEELEQIENASIFPFA